MKNSIQYYFKVYKVSTNVLKKEFLYQFSQYFNLFFLNIYFYGFYGLNFTVSVK